MILTTLAGAWAAFRSLPRGWHWLAGIALVLAAIAALWLWLGAREDAKARHNQDIGAAVQRERTATATIKQAEKANAAADNLRRSDDARRTECLRNARNPGDC